MNYYRVFLMSNVENMRQEKTIVFEYSGAGTPKGWEIPTKNLPDTVSGEVLSKETRLHVRTGIQRPFRELVRIRI